MSLNLNTTTKSLTLVTTAALAVDITVSFIDVTSSAQTPGGQTSNPSTATTTTIVSAPAASTVRCINDVEIVNKGAGTQTITIRVSDSVGPNDYVVFGPLALAQNERVHFTSDRGWRHFGINGGEEGPSGVALSHWNNFAPEASTGLAALPLASMWLFPVPCDQAFPGNMTLGTLKLGMSMSNNVTSGSGASSFASTVRFGLYTLANSTLLSLINSVSAVFTKAASSNNSAFVHGPRFLTVHSSQWSTQPVLQGSHYWMGVLVSTGNTAHGASFQAIGVGGRSNHSGDFNVSVGAQQEFYYFHGAINTTNIPGSVAASTVIGNDTRAVSVPLLVFATGIQTA